MHLVQKKEKNVLNAYKKMYNKSVEVPMYINGEYVKTGKTLAMSPFHDHQHNREISHRRKKSR